MRKPAILLSAFCFLLPLAACLAAHADDEDKQGIEFFEKKIRPVLVKHCYECHSADSKKLKGGLLLDTREAIRAGGESGHAVVPGNLDESVLISAIRYDDLEMPPKEQLPDSVIADFEKWVEMGAPDPRGETAVVIRREIDFDAARKFWSFQPVENHAPPKVRDETWGRSDIDRFVLARLESAGIAPVADADPHVLVRRIYFDLVGLPPTPEQADEFVQASIKNRQLAIENLVDRLLDSPQFGERWGRHWLDVVRYGESTGMERNYTYPQAWRFRDYVIKSFNDDKPFDQFVKEQVAGDLLPSQNIEQRDEQIVATGLLALGPKSLNNKDREQFIMDIVDEQIDVTTQAFLGFTAACARCHDHKFDPIPTKEYYSLAGIFRSTNVFYGTGGGKGNRQSGGLLALAADGVRPSAAGGGDGKKANANNNKNVAKQIKKLEQRVAQLEKQADKNDAAKQQLAKTEKQLERLKAQLKQTKRDVVAKPEPKPGAAPGATLVMGVQDAANSSDTELRIRGEANDRGETIPRGFLTILSHGDVPHIDGSGSGRLQYAEWLTQTDNPLTARVFVNRVWQHLFGRGIVATVNNFGANGEPPTHPELLDHLASRFVEEGWSTKKLIREIVTSRVYQLSSQATPKAAEIDPDNNLLSRMNQRRLEAEAIRDAMLAASGQLDLEPGQGSIVESIGDGDVGRTIDADRFATGSVKRSVYLPIVRSAVPEVLQVFDFPDPSIIFGQREVTTVPTQALYMMNSPFVIEQSKHFAERLLADDQLSDAQRLDLAYRLALSRSPSQDEAGEALEFLKTATSQDETGRESAPDAVAAAWSALCQTLYASSEFRYLD